MAGESLLSSVEAAVRALDSACIRYAVIGGVAAAAWGRARSTADADILIGIDPGTAEGDRTMAEAIDALRRAGFAHLERADRRRIGDRIVLHFWFPIRPQGLSVRVDLLAGSGNLDRKVIERAVVRKIDGFEVRIAACEDLILLKLSAGRPIDVVDAKELLALNRDRIDRAYLAENAARMGIEEELRGIGEGPERP